MNKEQIILQLYRNEAIENCLENCCPAHLRMDLKQHIFIILLDKTEADIISMHTKGMLQFYVIRTILNSVRGNGRSDFNRLFNSCGVELKDSTSIFYEEYNHDEERLMNECEAAAQELYWYNKHLLDEYIKLGSYRAVSKAIGIPTMAVFEAVKTAKEQIKKKVCT